MGTTQQGVSIWEGDREYGQRHSREFRLVFRANAQNVPDEMVEACLWCIAARGLDVAGRFMASWLTLGGRYAKVLLDSDSLPIDVASKAAVALKTVDPEFLTRFLRAAEQLSELTAILRGLSLLPAFGDYRILLSWLRTLCQHSDRRVRSRAVKLLCELRPNKGLIERQMQSGDARVRANAIETLWRSRTPDAAAIFKSAASDKQPRVVGNALVGLYLQGDESAFAKMAELSKHPDPLFRAAIAWCFGCIRDKRTIPLLYALAKDSSIMVRRRALESLLALQTDEPAPVMQPAASTA